MDAKRSFGERTVSRRREVRERVFLVVTVLILIAGVVAYFQSRAGEASTSATSPIQQEQTPSAPVVKSGGKLDPVAKGVAVRFIRSALGREELATAWNLAAPQLRSGVTKKQWFRGELPFPPFPVRDLTTTGFHVVGTSPKEVLLEVLLVPELNSGYVPTRYELTLERASAGAPWRVSYFLPYAPPGIYTEPQ